MKNAGHVVGDQQAVIAFLSDPRSHQGAEITRIDTHGAVVILAGERAYKLKRAVLFPYMDFSTLARRRQACEAEFAINRKTAPSLYLGVKPITRKDSGELMLDGGGEIVDWIVVMRRFDQAALFDGMVAENRLDSQLVQRLADTILRFHQSAAPTSQFGGIRGIEEVISLNDQGLRESALVNQDQVAALRDAGRTALDRVGSLLESRRRSGLVRHCHGDLHLGNICLFEGQPTLFDAIEFNDSISHIDTLYDLAFLLMDFEHRNRPDLGNHLFNRYFSEGSRHTGLADLSGLRTLPLFLSCRAGVRAQVRAAALAQAGRPIEAARLEPGAYLELALRYLNPPPPRLVAIGGLSGTGKSTLARALASLIGPSPGALHLRSDVVRKHLFGQDELDRLGPEAYEPEVTARVYETMRSRAAQALAAGHSVIMDAVHGASEEREGIEDVARDAGVVFDGIWMEASATQLEDRVTKRVVDAADASDATVEILHRQLGYAIGEMTWRRVDSSGSLEATLSKTRALLGLR